MQYSNSNVNELLTKLFASHCKIATRVNNVRNEPTASEYNVLTCCAHSLIIHHLNTTIMHNDVVQVLQSTPEQIAQGELDYLKDLIQEHNLASKVNPTTLDVVMFRIELGLLSAKEGFEAIQQLSKPIAYVVYPDLQIVVDYKDDELLYQVAKDGNTLRVQGIWKGQQFASTITTI